MIADRPSHLHLVWSRPEGGLPRERRAQERVNLAVAVERHLEGADGLSDDEFLTFYARGRRLRVVLPQSY